MEFKVKQIRDKIAEFERFRSPTKRDYVEILRLIVLVLTELIEEKKK